MGYGQSYYTLRSIFFDRIPPPVIHMHLRMFDVARDVPIGDLSSARPDFLPNGSSHSHSPSSSPSAYAPTRSSSSTPPTGATEVDIPESEKTAFDAWLRQLWTDKDDFITAFHASSHLSLASTLLHAVARISGANPKAVEIPVRLRRPSEIPHAFCYFGLAILGLAYKALA